MRGSPLLRAALVLLALLALAPLVRQVTARQSAVVPLAAQPVAVKRIHLALSFTAQPKSVSISHLGKQVWSKAGPGSQEECDLPLSWPREGIELLFRVEWPADAPLAAMRVKLTDPADNELERSLWGRGVVEDVLRFP